MTQKNDLDDVATIVAAGASVAVLGDLCDEPLKMAKISSRALEKSAQKLMFR